MNFPVALHPAESRDELDLTMLDRRDLSPIGYETINKSSGRAVERSDIVKGFEIKEDRFVVVTEEDLKKANVEATQTVDIVAFVDAKEIEPALFYKPYYLAPLKGGGKAYALLRETLRQTGRMGIARVVIRTRQYVAALYPMGRVLVLDLLRYAHEMSRWEDLDLPAESAGKQGLTKGEIDMAKKLIGEMVTQWKPEEYIDEYRRDFLKMIEHKAATGRVRPVAAKGERAAAKGGRVIDLMTLLKESLERKGKRAAAPKRAERSRKAGPSAASRGRARRGSSG